MQDYTDNGSICKLQMSQGNEAVPTVKMRAGVRCWVWGMDGGGRV